LYFCVDIVFVLPSATVQQTTEVSSSSTVIELLNEISINLKNLHLNLVVSPPMTPAVVAESTLRRTDGIKNWNSTDRIGSPLLNAEQLKIMKDLVKENSDKESVFVACMTPFLAECINRNYRVVANSETKPWIEILPNFNIARGKPDLWIGPYYIINSLEPPIIKDTKIAGAIQRLRNDKFIYGVPLYSNKADLWYDSIMPIAAKLQYSTTALGEAINSTYWFSQTDIQPSTRAMLITLDSFYLLKSTKGVITNQIVKANWTDNGSKNLIMNHFDIDSPWTEAIRDLCKRFEVEPVQFLGAGSYGRVIEVVENKPPHTRYALKVSAIPKNLPLLRLENMHIQQLIAMENARAVVPSFVSNLIEVPDRHSGYLILPVGESIRNESMLNFEEFSEVLNCLRLLHQNNIVHGDPRLPNILRRKVDLVDLSIGDQISPYFVYHQNSLPSSKNNPSKSVQNGYFFVDFFSSMTLVTPPDLLSISITKDLGLFVGYLISEQCDSLIKKDDFKELSAAYESSIKNDKQFSTFLKSIYNFVTSNIKLKLQK
jgi:hypothetical protein